MEVLAAFVRDRMRYTTIMDRLSKRSYFLWQQAGQPEGRSEEFWAEALRLELLEETPTDIAAIFTVINRRSYENWLLEIEKDWRFDFRGTYLRNAFLKYYHLERAMFSEAHLEDASLVGVHLEQADLFDTHLEGAFLDHAHLEQANLFDTHLERASLWRAHLEGANLREAHLEGADLSTAQGLTNDQLVFAHGDRKTKLPEEITRPKRWLAASHGQK